MYSTYIREFDKNVALLEEQVKKNPVFGTVVREFEVMQLAQPVFSMHDEDGGVAFAAVEVAMFMYDHWMHLLSDFTALCVQASPLCANLALKHYLLKPVQRIPQYQLLLTGTSAVKKQTNTLFHVQCEEFRFSLVAATLLQWPDMDSMSPPGDQKLSESTLELFICVCNREV